MNRFKCVKSVYSIPSWPFITNTTFPLLSSLLHEPFNPNYQISPKNFQHTLKSIIDLTLKRTNSMKCGSSFIGGTPTLEFTFLCISLSFYLILLVSLLWHYFSYFGMLWLLTCCCYHALSLFDVIKGGVCLDMFMFMFGLVYANMLFSCLWALAD